MDLNVSNYSIDELLEMLDIETSNVHIDIVIEKGRQMINDGNVNNDIVKFIKECIETLIKHYGWDMNKLSLLSEKGQDTVYVKQTNVSKGVINPLNIKTYTRLINLNTRFRDNYDLTKSTDLVVYIPDVIKKIVSMKVSSIEIPNTYYNISAAFKNNMFSIITYTLNGDIVENSVREIIRIQDGYYTPELLQDYLNLSIFGSSPLLEEPLDTSMNRIIAEYDGVRSRMLFKLNTSIQPYTDDYADNSFNLQYRFDVDFSIGNGVEGNLDPRLNLGWMLGYRNEDPYYDFSSNYVFDFTSGKFYSGGTVIPDEVGYNLSEGINGEFNVDMEMGYFLLDIDDGQNHTGQLMMNVMGENSMGGNSIAKIQVGRSERNSTNNVDNRVVTICRNDTNEVLRKREYFGPVDIERMRIRLLDEYGRVVDLNGTDYSLTLELEVLYD
jgi:hypothetical protein